MTITDPSAAEAFERIDDAVAELASDAASYTSGDSTDALRSRIDGILDRMRVFQNTYLPAPAVAPDPDSDLLDEDGYPTETALHHIRTFTGTAWELVEYVRSLWWSDLVTVEDAQNDYGRAVRKVSFVTGGWSGNEDLASTLERTLFHSVFWQTSSRGGLTVYEIPQNLWGTECPWGDPTLTCTEASAGDVPRRA